MAISFVREGCRKIAIADRNREGLEETRDLLKRIVTPSCPLDLFICDSDISQEADVQRLVDGTVEMFGRIDYACNAAGILSKLERSHEMSAADFDRINDVNYRGCWLSSRAEIAQMMKQEPLLTHDGRPGNRGSVVNIASQLGIVGRTAARK